MASNPHKSIALNFPNVVAPLASSEDLAALAGLLDPAAHCDVLELRLDALPFPDFPTVALPVIATARHPAEGGVGDLSSETRRTLLADKLPLASALDIEIRSLPGFADIVSEARAANVLVLGSYHDFDATPGIADLRETVQRGLDLGAAAVKIATRLHGPGDLHRLIELLEFYPETPLSVMGMGPLGMASRLLAAQCGSFLNYGYLVTPNAPGQWPARQLRAILADARG